MLFYLYCFLQKSKKKIQKYIFQSKPGKKMSFKPFESKLSPFPWRNTGQTISIGVKNKFQAVLGRSHHF
jgi:hypothetical protein